ncbi:MAG: AraC family transcriptional regulator [Candidatus Nanoarchaeia archaeon]
MSVLISKSEILKRAENVLKNLDHHARCGGVFYEASNKCEILTGKAFCRLCKACVMHPRAGVFCRQSAISNAYKSLLRGDGFHTKCWLGLNCLTFPVAPDGNEILGAIEIGGILFKGELQKEQHQIMSILNSIGTEEDNLNSFMNAFQGIEELPDINIEMLNEFTKEALFSAGLLNAKKFAEKNAFWKQQERITERLAQIRQRNDDDIKKSFEQMTLELLDAFEKGISPENLTTKIDTIISLILHQCGEEVNKIKARCLTLLSILYSSKVFRGAKWEREITSYFLKIEELSRMEDVKSICFWIDKIFKRLFSETEKQNESITISEKINNYLLKNYSEKISIREVAKAIGASPSSIMHKLKAETGITFTEVLNNFRIKEAKRLLAFTMLSISEISIRCGFSDQSYFTKVFRKNVNMSPKEFRKML